MNFSRWVQRLQSKKQTELSCWR